MPEGCETRFDNVLAENKLAPGVDLSLDEDAARVFAKKFKEQEQTQHHERLLRRALGK